jgi:hypothetical protein
LNDDQAPTYNENISIYDLKKFYSFVPYIFKYLQS